MGARVLVLFVALFLGSAIGCSERPRDLAAFSGTELRRVDDDTGVNVRVFAEGVGRAAADGDVVRLHYVLRLADGTVIESSHEREPLAILVGHDAAYIEGLHRGLLGARVGELREIIVPPALGYRGRDMAKIPPTADLHFAAQIIDITAPAK